MDNLVLTPAQLGKALHGARKLRGLSQKQVGASVGMKQSTVSVIESDCARTSVESLYKLLSALDLELVVRSRPGVRPVGETAPEQPYQPVEW